MDSGDSALRQRLQTGFLGIIAFALILFLLVQASFILIALVIAIIIFSLTSDAIAAVGRLHIGRLRVPNWLATLAALAMIALGLLWLSAAIVAQVNELLSTAISYATEAEGAVAGISSRLGPDFQEAITTAVRGFNITYWLRSIAGQASSMVSMSMLIILFVGFMFAERAWFPVKVLHLAGGKAGAERFRDTVRVIMHRVNRYLVVKAVVSAMTAMAVWWIFTIAGLELAGPIAMITFGLNFLPSIGSIIATILAVLVTWVQSGNDQLTIGVGIACTTVQFIIGNVLDPYLLGRTLRLSPFGIILSLAFWGAIWGFPGMFLAVPISVALMIVCSRIEWLRPVAILLSREGLPDSETEPAG
ncbi:AI-2E family transporter [Paracoccus pacificus]|uniref:AI-2E family transporter n=1 Tax=Paracoccus pacificus TaxID=1463598 RepID=A0ABW4RAL1_9RHOB